MKLRVCPCGVQINSTVRKLCPVCQLKADRARESWRDRKPEPAPVSPPTPGFCPVERADSLKCWISPTGLAASDGRYFWEFNEHPDEVVYFVRNTASGNYKIGVTKNLGNRLSDIQVHNECEVRLVAYFAGTLILEQALHRTFAPARVRGEWFLGSVVQPVLWAVRGGLSLSDAIDAYRAGDAERLAASRATDDDAVAVMRAQLRAFLERRALKSRKGA